MNEKIAKVKNAFKTQSECLEEYIAELSGYIEDISSSKEFFSLPVDIILQTIEKSGATDVDLLCKIVHSMSLYKKEDAPLILNFIDIDEDDSLDGCIKILSCFSHCKICQKIASFIERSKNLPTVDFQAEIKSLKAQNEELKASIISLKNELKTSEEKLKKAEKIVREKDDLINELKKSTDSDKADEKRVEKRSKFFGFLKRNKKENKETTNKIKNEEITLSSLISSNKIKNKKITIGLYGKPASGKSGLILNYLDELHDIGHIDPTIEDNYKTKVNLYGQVFDVHIIEYGCYEDFYQLWSLSMKNIDGALLVYAVDDRESYEDIDSFYSTINKMNKGIPVVLCCNKCDMEDRIYVSSEERRILAEKLSCKSFDTSVISFNGNVKEAFRSLFEETLLHVNI